MHYFSLLLKPPVESMLADVRYHVTSCQSLALHNIKEIGGSVWMLVEMIFFVLFCFCLVLPL